MLGMEDFQMTRAWAPVSSRLQTTGTHAPTEAKKKPWAPKSAPSRRRLIATVPSSEIDLNSRNHNHLTISNSHSERCFWQTQPPPSSIQLQDLNRLSRPFKSRLNPIKINHMPFWNRHSNRCFWLAHACARKKSAALGRRP